MKWGGGGMVVGGNGTTDGSPAVGGGGRGGRGVFLADRVLVSNMLDLLFTGGGGATGSTGREERQQTIRHETGNVSHDQI